MRKAELKRNEQIEKIRTIVSAKSGNCPNISEYTSRNTKMNFICAKQHSWVCSAQNVLKGRWCPTCAGVAKRTLADVIAIVADNSGILLSTEYKNNYTNLDVICKEHHKFQITASSLFQGHWCRQCAIFGEKLDRRLYSIGEVRHICNFRNGKYLGDESDLHPISTDHYARYQCFDGHIWSAQYDSIIRGHWCPVCRDPNIDAMTVIESYRKKSVSMVNGVHAD